MWECKGRGRGGWEEEDTPWLRLKEHLCRETTSGAYRYEIRQKPHVREANITSLGVDTRLLFYVSSVTWMEKEVLEGEVREQDSQEQQV